MRGQTIRHRGRHVFDSIKAGSFEGGGLDNTPFGRHFYLDPVKGSAGYPGKSAGAAKKTLAQALALCTAYKGDVIHVARGTQSVSAAVVIDVHGVTIIAEQLFNPMGNGEEHTIYGTHTDGPAAIILAPCNIIGMGFVGSQVAGPSLLIDCEEQSGYEGGFNWLYQCRFSQWGITKAYALKTLGGALNLIEACYFDGLFAGYTIAAISLHNDGNLAAYDTWLKDNIFTAIGNGKYCIEFASGSVPNGVLISGNMNNRTYIDGSQQAKFLNTNAVTGSGHIFDNYPGFATDTASYDRSVSQMQTQGFLFSNNHYNEL